MNDSSTGLVVPTYGVATPVGNVSLSIWYPMTAG